jgi:hypothetical protein
MGVTVEPDILLRPQSLLVLFLLDLARASITARSFAAGEVNEVAGLAHQVIDADGERRLLGSMIVHQV